MKSVIESIDTVSLGKTWLFWMGQAGFIFKSAKGSLLGIDLYLSECVEQVEGHAGYHRQMPQLVEPAELNLDFLIATHFHRDHFDVDAIPQLMNNGYTRLFCAYDCQEDVEFLNIDKTRTTFVRPDDTYEADGFRLSFVRCDHGTGAPQAVGVIVTVDEKRALVVGDSCLHLDWKDDYLKEGPIDVLIAPINGAYGNLTEQENVDLTALLKPRLSVPCHFGMFASHGGHLGLWKELMDNQLPEQEYKLFTMGEGIEI